VTAFMALPLPVMLAGEEGAFGVSSDFAIAVLVFSGVLITGFIAWFKDRRSSASLTSRMSSAEREIMALRVWANQLAWQAAWDDRPVPRVLPEPPDFLIGGPGGGMPGGRGMPSWNDPKGSHD
jgi:hypothetical protein